jgi:hypothetical protein
MPARLVPVAPRGTPAESFAEAIRSDQLRIFCLHLLAGCGVDLVYQRRTGSSRECVGVFYKGWKLAGHVYSSTREEPPDLIAVRAGLPRVIRMPDLASLWGTDEEGLADIRHAAHDLARSWGLPPLADPLVVLL